METCRRYRCQIIATMIVGLMMLSHGIVMGWFAPMHVYLESEDSPFDERLTVYQASWCASILAIGGFVVNLFSGPLLYYFGRKPLMYFLVFPHAIHWALIFFGTNAIYLFVARFLAGMTGGACFAVFPLFVAEIADSSIRGTLTTCVMMCICTGLLIGYIMASFMPYKVLPCIVIFLPLTYFVLVLFLPETPFFLLRSGKTEKAQKSLYFYKSLSKENPESMAEFIRFQEAMIAQVPAERLNSKDYCNREAWKSYGLILVLVICNQMSGNFAIVTYATTIFKNLDIDFNIFLCTISLGVAQLMGMTCAILLVDRVGRRILFLSSLSGVAVGEVTIASLKYFASKEFMKEYGWFAVLTMTFIGFSSAFGVASVTILVVVELLPIKIISFGTAISIGFFSICAFTSLKIYPVLIAEEGLGATMMMSASVCIVGFIILVIFLPETKKKPLA